MRKIRLSDNDLELFDIEILPTDYTFYQKHKDAFKTMWTEQGKSFWIRFVITFRSFTVKHGVIKQMNIDSPKFQNLIDQAFIFIHEQFVDGKVNIAKNFLEDLAQLAQNQDKFPGLDSKSFSKDPFYSRDTRELFRKFFGMPDQKTSYLKVYILFPVYLRFGGSVCRALIRWVDADPMDPSDDSYWTAPQSNALKSDNHDTCEHSMCCNCNIECETKFFCEKREGRKNGPRFLDCWTLGDPRFTDPENPFFAPHLNPNDDWRVNLSLELYRDFYQYAKIKYGRPKDKCSECLDLRRSCDQIIQAYKNTKKKQKKKDGDSIDLDQLLGSCTCPHIHEHIENSKDSSPPRQEKKDENQSVNKTNTEKTKIEWKGVFGENAVITSEFEQALDRGMELFKNKVAGFKVIKIEDAKNGLFEVNVSVASLKTDEQEKQHNDKMKKIMLKQLLNVYILNADILRSQIDGLPKKLEWWEGRGFAIAVLNYELEEKEFTKKWTNFALKISGFEEVQIKKLMMKLLHYVAKRKKRICYGWNMVVDDVVTCMLPENSQLIDDLSISIQRGFRFEDRLTEEEKDSLLKHQPNLRLDKVLMGIEAGDAPKLLAERGGKEKLKKMIAAVADRQIYEDDLPVVDTEKLRKKLNNKVDITQRDVMWEQIMLNPEKFEFFVLMEKEKESELWELGMKSMDIRYFLSNKKPKVKICPVCKIVGKDCTCEKPMVISPDISKFMETSKLQEVKLLEEAAGPALPKFSYREYKSYSMDEGGNKKVKKPKKTKQKKIELLDLPAKFREVGIKSEKTTISIPANQDAPLLGNVPIDSSEKPDKMAPVPGLTSSLNFTFQNGQKQQTITVSLGAYMPEEKLNLLADNSKLLKLCGGEEKRNEQALHRRKDEKRNKRDKSAKKKSSSKDKIHPPAKDPDIITAKSKEKQANLTGLLMNEFIGTLEAKDVERQVNQHLGVSTKKQNLQKKDNSLWAKYENDGEKVTPPVADEKGDNSKDSSVDNSKECSNDNSADNSKENGSNYNKLDNTKESNDNSKESGSNDNSKESGSNDNSADKGLVSDVGMIEQETNNNKKTSKQEEKMERGSGSEENESEGNSKKLKSCWNCQVVEQKRKAFKKCQKCKEEGVLDCRYYCGRDCQVEDWKNRHKQEHKEGILTC